MNKVPCDKIECPLNLNGFCDESDYLNCELRDEDVLGGFGEIVDTMFMDLDEDGLL